MPRIRTIKPEFFTSLTIASLPLEARLTFIGLWTHVDDEGRCVDDTRLIRAAVWPLDERLSSDIETDLKRLTESSLIVRYEVDGRRYLAVQGWREHQKINRPTLSKLPAPPDRPIHRGHQPPPAETQPSGIGGSHQRPLTEDSLAERKGKEGKGREGKGVPPPADAGALTLSTPYIVGEWLEHCRKRPPGNVVGQVGRSVKAMLAEGIDPVDVRRGLAAWHSKGLHPSTLPSIVNQLMNATGTIGTVPRPSTTDQRVNAALQLAAQFDAAEVA